MKTKVEVASKAELQNGAMKETEVNGKKILIANVENNYYAVDAICPHHKAPLAEGALCGTKLYCPWHHSVFEITTGKLCEPPALHGLQHYETETDAEKVFVLLPEKEDKPKPFEQSGEDKRSFVIIGGGAVGCIAAKTLRDENYEGNIVMITKEKDLPYDRTSLSKKFLAGKQKPEELPLLNEEFYSQFKINVEQNKEVIEVDAHANTLKFSDGTDMRYDQLLIATGSKPNALDVEGAQLKNVFKLRSAEDAKQIVEQIKKAKRVVIVGASFIGMETTSSLKARGLEVTVIAKQKIPFEKILGEEIGNMFKKLHEENGVNFKWGANVKKIEGKESAEAVILYNGERIETDMVLIGVGVKPRTSFLKNFQLDEKDKAVKVDEFLQASPNIFAAGDIASYSDVITNKNIRIEHWRVAQQHGRVAAFNMLGKKEKITNHIPFFWTEQFEQSLSYVGHAEEWDEIIYDGDISKHDFSAFYIKDNLVNAVASMNRDKESNTIEDILLKQRKITLAELQEKLKQALKQ